MSNTESYKFRYTSRLWEVVVMFLFLVPCMILGGYLRTYYQSDWFLAGVIPIGFFLPYLLLHFWPRLFSLSGYGVIDTNTLIMQLKFHKVMIPWATITSIRFLPTERGRAYEHYKNRGLNINTNNWKSIRLYPVDQTLRGFYEIVVKHYELNDKPCL